MFVQQFLDWSATASVDQRSDAIERLAKAFLEGSIAESDRLPTERVLTLFLSDPSSKVRRSMACALSNSDSAPRTLIWSLMQDVPAVACEIYARSPQLRTADLDHGARNCDGLIQTAIAGRSDLTVQCAQQLVLQGSENAIVALLQNTFIQLSPSLKHDLAQRMGALSAVRNLLLTHDDLMPSTRQLLVTQLSDCLLDMVDTNAWAPRMRVAAAANDARNTVTHEIALQAEAEEIGTYVEHLRETAQLTPALLVRTICLGNMALFEASIAALSGSSLNRVRSVVSEGRIRSFKALYVKTSLPQNAYPAFAAAITAWQQSSNAGDVLRYIISDVAEDPTIDSAIVAMLSRMETELHQKAMRSTDVVRQALAA